MADTAWDEQAEATAVRAKGETKEEPLSGLVTVTLQRAGTAAEPSSTKPRREITFIFRICLTFSSGHRGTACKITLARDHQA
jgi:hypothetical protein